MMITRENYEAFAVDYFDGNMSPDQKMSFLGFLAENQDLKQEIESMDWVILETPVHINHPNKAALLKTPAKKISLRRWLSVAAAVLLLITAGRFIIEKNMPQDDVITDIAIETTATDELRSNHSDVDHKKAIEVVTPERKSAVVVQKKSQGTIAAIAESKIDKPQVAEIIVDTTTKEVYDLAIVKEEPTAVLPELDAVEEEIEMPSERGTENEPYVFENVATLEMPSEVTSNHSNTGVDFIQPIIPLQLAPELSSALDLNSISSPSLGETVVAAEESMSAKNDVAQNQDLETFPVVFSILPRKRLEIGSNTIDAPKKEQKFLKEAFAKINPFKGEKIDGNDLKDALLPSFVTGS